MKPFRFVFILAVASVLPMASLSYGWTTNLANPQEGHGKKHEFSVRQYEDFHDILHPLQHEALPSKDFRGIRAKSALLVKRGNAIVRLGVPRRVTATNKDEFARELNEFREAVAKFRVDARRGTDSQLEASFNAVHDSFEMLAAMLPKT